MGDQGSFGHEVARDVATRDELKQAIEGEDAGPTRDHKGDKVQPRISTRADHEGAGR